MFKSALKSLAFSCKTALTKAGTLKNVNRITHKSSFFSTFNVPPNNDQLDKDKKVNAEISKDLFLKGQRFVGMLCVTGSLIHLDLNGIVLLASSVVASMVGISNHEKEPNAFNWSARAASSFMWAGLWQTSQFAGASTFVTLFPSTMLLIATVYGASSLYARFATRVCAYRPAVVGTLAGMTMIAVETGQFFPNTLMTALYTPEQLSLAYIYMCNTLPVIAITATGCTMGTINDKRHKY